MRKDNGFGNEMTKYNATIGHCNTLSQDGVTEDVVEKCLTELKDLYKINPSQLDPLDIFADRTGINEELDHIKNLCLDNSKALQDKVVKDASARSTLDTHNNKLGEITRTIAANDGLIKSHILNLSGKFPSCFTPLNLSLNDEVELPPASLNSTETTFSLEENISSYLGNRLPPINPDYFTDTTKPPSSGKHKNTSSSNKAPEINISFKKHAALRSFLIEFLSMKSKSANVSTLIRKSQNRYFIGTLSGFSLAKNPNIEESLDEAYSLDLASLCEEKITTSINNFIKDLQKNHIIPSLQGALSDEDYAQKLGEIYLVIAIMCPLKKKGSDLVELDEFRERIGHIHNAYTDYNGAKDTYKLEFSDFAALPNAHIIPKDIATIFSTLKKKKASYSGEFFLQCIPAPSLSPFLKRPKYRKEIGDLIELMISNAKNTHLFEKKNNGKELHENITIDKHGHFHFTKKRKSNKNLPNKNLLPSTSVASTSYKRPRTTTPERE